MREIDQPQDAEQQADAKGRQHVQAAETQGVGFEILQQTDHRSSRLGGLVHQVAASSKPKYARSDRVAVGAVRRRARATRMPPLRIT